MKKSEGQDPKIWDSWWGEISPLSEIRMWDYYGGRQWISKYIPRYGKVVEGGCGVGRYVFYFRRLGIDIEGIDFSEKVISRLQKTKQQIDNEAVFIKSDVRNLPYRDDSLSGYVSLGVVEHFVEGPKEILAEAFRKLRPGGIAIVTTPNISFFTVYKNLIQNLKNILKCILGRNIISPPFFQYEYRPGKLKKVMKEVGFYISRAEGFDLLFPFTQFGKFTGNNLRKGSFAYWFANKFEDSILKTIGAQSVIIAIKKAPLMHCFLSGKLSAKADSLNKFDIPISPELYKSALAKLYIKGKKVKYADKYEINPEILKPENRICELSDTKYLTDEIFEDFGFNKNVSPDLLKVPEINIELSVNHVRPLWRNRKN